MKVEYIDDSLIDIFFNTCYFKDIDYKLKDNLISRIKELVNLVNERFRLGLKGFYKIKAYFNDYYGLYLNVVKIDDNDFNNQFEFRIVLCQDSIFFLEFTDYDDIDNDVDKYFYNNCFYVLVDSIDKSIKYLDNCRVVFGDEASLIFNKSKIYKKRD